MASYYGFAPGTYQPWALNLTMDALGQQGVARGMSVGPATPASMNVVVGVDAVQGDGVCFLPNGAWFRIDATLQLAVPNNTSGSTRTDAVVVQVDPTGVLGSQIAYVTGWTSNFNPQAYSGSANNELVLAIISVPNNAATIAQGNITNTPLVAQMGNTPLNHLDGPVGSERANVVDGDQPGVFSLFETQITSSATNGQTSFSPALTALQRLVPQGRIGGGLETGYFSGPNGWYWPKVRGSVSGLLPVSSVDPVAGTITTATGAQTGEAVYLSYKYYDFSRDAKVRGGSMFIEKTSPYIVYQGEVVEDPYGTTTPLWDGSQGGYLLQNIGESVFYTDYTGGIVGIPFLGGPGGQQNQVQYFVNSVSQATRFTNANGAPGTNQYMMHWVNTFVTGNQVNVIQLKLVSGILGLSGFRNHVTKGSSVYVSGGLVNVQGQPVLLQSTSIALNRATNGKHQSYTVYTDRYGNITTTAAMAAGMERTLARIPLAGAAQFGSPVVNAVATSSSYGSWPMPAGYLGLPTSTVWTSYSTASPTIALGNGWSLQQDINSPNGAYMLNNSSDVLMASAVCTGMDLLVKTSNKTAAIQVLVDTPPPAVATTVYVASGTQYNVRLTLFSNLPFGTHTVYLTAITNALTGFDSLDIRVPATPAPPPNTLPLAQVDVFGYSSKVTTGFTRGARVGDSNLSTTIQVMDKWRPFAEPAVYYQNFSNGNSNNPIVWSMPGTGGAIVHYAAGPDKGIISLSGFSLDTYAVSPVMDTTFVYPLSGDVTSISFSSGNTKNGSSTGTPIAINSIEVFPWYTHVTDLRHYGLAHGMPSELRGSALQGFQGQRYDDGGLGIRTQQVRDRSITSRKVTPAWARGVGTASFSGFPGIYPSAQAKITVEVPSVLLVTVHAGVRASPTPSWFRSGIALDGIFYNESGGTQFDFSTDAAVTGGTNPIVHAEMVPVPAGTHTIQWGVPANSAAAPYYDGTSPVVINVLAFAL